MYVYKRDIFVFDCADRESDQRKSAPWVGFYKYGVQNKRSHLLAWIDLHPRCYISLSYWSDDLEMELHRLTTVSFRAGRRGGGFDLIELAGHCASNCGADTGKKLCP